MFLLKCLVDDRHLATVLKRLAGVAHNVLPVPIANAKPNAKKGRPAIAPGENISEVIFNQHLSKTDMFAISAIRKYLSDLGRSPGSAQYVVKELIKRKLVRSSKVRGTYLVNKKTAAEG